ncbi:MAG: Coq4 family protein [Sediminibacterium sp.]
MFSKLKKIRCSCLIALTHNVALPVLKQVRKVKTFPYTKEQLQQMKDETVGKDLAIFLGDRQLQLLSHYARHDMKHVVLGYDTTEEGELCLQSFMLGNGRISFPVLATVLFGFLIAPEYWKKMYRAFRKGKHCMSVHGWNWFELVQKNTMDLRNEIFISRK